jgi:sugar lactone lactonase YvrE
MSGLRHTLGEGPWWSVMEQRLYWVDILKRAVYRAAIDASDQRVWQMPSEVGCVVPRLSGGAIAVLCDGLYDLNLESGRVSTLLRLEADLPGQRFNDGKCDRQGRLWFGSMHVMEQEPVGALYRYDPDGSCVKVYDGITTSNGLGWSPDSRLMYHTDSMARRITVADYDAGTGMPSGRRTFAITEPGFNPDGLTVDADGYVWSAVWNGARVRRYAPDGRIDREVTMPVWRPTSCMFAGPGLQYLVVTSASWETRPTTADPSLAGATFVLNVGVKGLEEAPFAG